MAWATCAACGAAVDAGAGSCAACEAPLPLRAAGPSREASPRAERRPLTVLFCDIVDSVALTSALDPEDMLSVLDAFRTACGDVVSRHRGSIAAYAGDGALAYFGHPTADEEDAAHGVRAALALQSAIRTLPLPHGIVCQARIGVATGFVVFDDRVMGGGRRETGIVGDAPNLAARLQAAAPPGGIAVAETTQRITSGQFVYRQFPPLRLKGYHQPVQAFEALAETEAGHSSRARAESARNPIFGRERELLLLVDLWSKAREGGGQIVLIRGEAGIGKSRLVEATRRHGQVADYLQWTWNCGPDTLDSALYPVVAHLTKLGGFERGDSVEARRAKLRALMARHRVSAPHGVAVMGDLLGLPPASPQPLGALTPEKLKALTLDALVAFFDAWAHGRPALLAIEDLHWSDSTTLELLDRLVARSRKRRWMILATARPEFVNRWPGEVVEIELGRLDRVAAERICAHHDSAATLPAEACRQIVARCDGVPLFIEETTKAVVEGVATSARSGSQRLVIPATLHDSLAARLDRLGDARRIANIGAAIGRRFGHDLLAEVTDESAGDLDRGLLVLKRSGLIELSGATPNCEYAFRHALIRDAAYESILKREREALHGRIAIVLRDRFPELRESQPELLAHHLTESGALLEAIPLWAAAGQRAASRAAHVEAVGHLETALDLTRRQPPGPERAAGELQLLLGLWVSLAAAHGYAAPEVAVVLQEARVLCDAMGNAPELFAVHRSACSFHIVAVQIAAAEEAARLCLDIAGRTGQPEHLIESQFAYGYVVLMRGEPEQARFYLENAIELYRRHDGATLQFPSPHDPNIGALSALLAALHALGDDAGADRVEEELDAHVQRLDRAYDRVYSLFFRMFLAAERADYVRLRAFADEAVTLCDEQCYFHYSAFAACYRGIAIARLEDPEAGLHMALRGLDALDRMGGKHGQLSLLTYLALLRMDMGDRAEALSIVDEGIARALAAGEGFPLAGLYRARSKILARAQGSDLPAPGPGEAATPAPPLDGVGGHS